jgi:hypothetical protein
MKEAPDAADAAADAAQAGNVGAEKKQEAGALQELKQGETKPKPKAVTVDAEAGQFAHQPEDAEEPCVTPRPEPRCRCGLYELTWPARAHSER